MNRSRLLPALVAGKAFDSLSTVLVLPMESTIYESQWLARRFIAAFGLVGGMAVSLVTAVALVAVVAESGEAVARVCPAAWVPPWYADAVRAGVYGAGACWYALVGVQNFLLVA